MKSFLLLQLVIVAFSTKQKHSRPFCSPENLKLRNASTGNWFILPDGSLSYEYSHCQLRKFSREAAASCLQGSHIAFIGDSVSRYFYVSLAYLFVQRKWPSPFSINPVLSHSKPSILYQKDWIDWPTYFHVSNSILSSQPNLSFELCDCHRDNVKNLFLENRHFRFYPKNDINNQGKDVRLSFFLWLGELVPVNGHKRISFYPRNESFHNFTRQLNAEICPTTRNSFNTFYPLTQSCLRKRSRSKEVYSSDFPSRFCRNFTDCDSIYSHPETNHCQSFERDVLQPLETTHTIINTGWHSSLKHCDPLFLKKVIDSSDKYFANHSSSVKLPKVLWRSCTTDAPYCSGDALAKAYLHVEKDRSKFDYFDVHSMTMKLKEIHFYMVKGDLNGFLSAVRLSPSWSERQQTPPNMKFLSSIASTMVDKAHFEPWVNNLINRILLNAVCPLQNNNNTITEDHVDEATETENLEGYYYQQMVKAKVKPPVTATGTARKHGTVAPGKTALRSPFRSSDLNLRSGR
jgi:hypothetical protein